MAKRERRFRGALTTHYQLFKLACSYGAELDAALRRVVRVHRARRDGRPLEVLELGCGTGTTTSVLLGARRDLRVTAIDSEPGMVAQARRALAGEARATIVLAGALPFLRRSRARRFDIVASANTLHNLTVDERRRVLREIARTLKSGGLFVNADKYALDGPAQGRALRARIASYFKVAVPRKRLDFLLAAVLHCLADEAPERQMKEKDAVRFLRALGFGRIRRIFRRDLTAVITARRGR